MIISKNISHFSCHTAHLWLSLLYHLYQEPAAQPSRSDKMGCLWRACHQPKIAGPVSHLNLPRHLLTGGFDHRISGALGAHVFANPWDYRMASYLYSICWVCILYTVCIYIYTYWLIKLALRGLRFRRWAFMRGHLCLDMHIHSQTKMIINVRTWKGYIYYRLLYYMKLYYIIIYYILYINVIMIHNVSKLSRTILIYPDSIG